MNTIRKSSVEKYTTRFVEVDDSKDCIDVEAIKWDGSKDCADILFKWMRGISDLIIDLNIDNPTVSFTIKGNKETVNVGHYLVKDNEGYIFKWSKSFFEHKYMLKK